VFRKTTITKGGGKTFAEEKESRKYAAGFRWETVFYLLCQKISGGGVITGLMGRGYGWKADSLHHPSEGCDQGEAAPSTNNEEGGQTRRETRERSRTDG